MSRGMVAASPYSHASARKPGGGGGSSMSLDQQPALTHHVYVSAQRAVHEGQVRRPGRPLRWRRRRGGRARPASTAPRGCGRRSSRCRGLEQRVVQEQQEAAARLEHPGHLVDRGLERVEVLEHQAHRRPRRRTASRTAALGRCACAYARAAAALAGDDDLRRGRVDARRRSTPERGERAGRAGPRRTRRRAPGGAGEVPLDEREDLLLVLGVGAVGELAPATTARAVSQGHALSVGIASSETADCAQSTLPSSVEHGARNRPVWLSAVLATCSGGPSTIDAPTAVAALGTEVDDPVGRLDRRRGCARSRARCCRRRRGAAARRAAGARPRSADPVVGSSRM